MYRICVSVVGPDPNTPPQLPVATQDPATCVTWNLSELIPEPLRVPILKKVLLPCDYV